MMKGVRISRHGGLDVLHYGPIPTAKNKQNEVLVKVRACALNHLDLWVRKGIVGLDLPLPVVPGSDISGVVENVGKMVQGVKKGDRVILAPGVSCGECKACLAGEDQLCPKYQLLGFRRDGGCAEFVSVPPSNVLPMPKALTFVEAASVPLVFLTAWHMLVSRAKVQPGEDVLILGGSSGVGSAAIQIAKLFGARVITTVGKDWKIAKALEIGADDVVLHTKTNFFREVMRLTKKKGVEVVIEHVGPATWEKSLQCLAVGGRLVTCGATTGPLVKVDLRYVFSRHLSLLGSYMGSKAELMSLLPYFDDEKLKPVVDRVMALKEIRAAHESLENRENFGKIVLTPRATSRNH